MPAALLASIAVLLICADASRAADVLAPADGATVPSRPTFAVNFAAGTIEVQLAKAPDVLTAGPQAGAFVEPVREAFMLIGQPPGIAAWNWLPLNAGRWYWHARLNDYATEEARGFVAEPWLPARVLHVADEPPLIEGWTLRSRRMPRSTCANRSRYRYAYQLTGTIRWSDNSQRPAADYVLALRHASGRTLRLRGELHGTTARYAQLVCTNVTAARAELRITDDGGNTAMGRAKSLRLR